MGWAGTPNRGVRGERQPRGPAGNSAGRPQQQHVPTAGSSAACPQRGRGSTAGCGMPFSMPAIVAGKRGEFQGWWAVGAAAGEAGRQSADFGPQARRNGLGRPNGGRRLGGRSWGQWRVLSWHGQGGLGDQGGQFTPAPRDDSGPRKEIRWGGFNGSVSTTVYNRGQGRAGPNRRPGNEKTPEKPGFCYIPCFQSLLCYRYTIPQVITFWALNTPLFSGPPACLSIRGLC